MAADGTTPRFTFQIFLPELADALGTTPAALIPVLMNGQRSGLVAFLPPAEGHPGMVVLTPESATRLGLTVDDPDGRAYTVAGPEDRVPAGLVVDDDPTGRRKSRKSLKARIQAVSLDRAFRKGIALNGYNVVPDRREREPLEILAEAETAV